MNRLEFAGKKIGRLEMFFLALIVIGALFVRLYKISSPLADWHSWRQSDTAAVSRIYLKEGIDLFSPRYFDISMAQTGVPNPEGYRYVEFPLYNVMHTMGVRVFAPKLKFVTVGRLISIIASLVSIVFIYLLGRKFIDPVGGLLSAFFFAFIPYSIFYSRVILPEPLAVMLGLAAMWSFVYFTESDSKYSLFLSAFFFALSILVKPFTIFYGLPLLLLLFTRQKLPKVLNDKRIWMFILIVVAPLALWRLWESRFPEGIPHIKWAFNGDGIRFRPSFWRWIFGERLGKLILGVWGLVPFSVGLMHIKKKNSFIGWFLMGVFLFTSIFATANVRHDYYQIVVVPAVSLCLGLGFVNMWEGKGKNKYAVRMLLLFSVGMMFIVGWDQVKGYYQINNFSIVKAGSATRGLIPQDARVIAPYNKDTAFLNQTERFGWPYLDGSIDEMIERGANYYVSVSYDAVTLNLMDKFTIIDQTDEYVIIKL